VARIVLGFRFSVLGSRLKKTEAEPMLSQRLRLCEYRDEGEIQDA